MKKLFSTLFIAAFTLTTFAQEKVLFKLNPTQGKSLPYEMTVKTDIDGAQSVIMDMQFKFNMTATDVQNESVVIDTKFAQIKTEVDAGMMAMSYDSSNETDDEMSKMLGTQFKPILENTLTLTLDKFGKVLDSKFPNVADGAFDKSSMEGLATEFPNKEIALGESWETTKDFPQLNLKGTIKFTYSEKAADGHKITTYGEFKDAAGNVVGTTNGHSIVDATTFMNKYSISESKLEVQGTKITTSAELKIAQ